MRSHHKHRERCDRAVHAAVRGPPSRAPRHADTEPRGARNVVGCHGQVCSAVSLQTRVGTGVEIDLTARGFPVFLRSVLSVAETKLRGGAGAIRCLGTGVVEATRTIYFSRATPSFWWATAHVRLSQGSLAKASLPHHNPPHS